MHATRLSSWPGCGALPLHLGATPTQALVLAVRPSRGAIVGSASLPHRHGRLRSMCKASSGGGASWELDPDEERAMIEAGEILAEAERMSAEETFREMMRSAVQGSSSGEPQGNKSDEEEGSVVSEGSEPGLATVMLGFGSEVYYPEAVKALQRLLGSEGFQPQGEYGTFGRRTEAALQGYQSSRGLEASGVLDAKTLDAITDRKREIGLTKAEEESMKLLRMFWHTEGLCRDSRSRILLDRLKERLASSVNPQEMDVYFVRLQRLHRLLPKVDILKVAIDEPEVLTKDISVLTFNLVTLLQALPGQDIEKTVSAYPRLLWQDGVMLRVKTCVECYARWSPASDPVQVRYSVAVRTEAEGRWCGALPQILAENPSLIIRIPDYYSEAELGDLPIDIQNSMMIGGGGGGVAFRSWSGFNDNHTD